MLDNSALTLPQDDIVQIASELSSIWPSEKSIFITGGTGFFGRWIVESIFAIEKSREKSFNKKNQYYVLSRRPYAEVIKSIPVLAADFFKLIQADITELNENDIPTNLDYVIHGAVDVSTYKQDQSSTRYGSGTDRLLKLIESKNVQRLLYLSSGAVYEGVNQSPFSEVNIKDDDLQKMTAKAYTNEKRVSESLVVHSGIPYFILRCFAFVGPYLSESMAIMGMLRAKVEGCEITVNSPSTVRSFLYPVDLVTQLFKVLFLQTSSTAFNLGSPNQISLGELANAIAKADGNVTTVVLKPIANDNSLGSSQYVPNMAKLYTALNIQKPTVDLSTALSKTLDFEKIKRGIK